MSLLSCSLCNMQFNTNEPLIQIMLKRHTDFHRLARIQRRNTTQGIPTYEGGDNE